jgi:hypothetical protein
MHNCNDSGAFVPRFVAVSLKRQDLTKKYSNCVGSFDVGAEIYIGLRVKCPLFLSHLNETWNVSTDFSKAL